MIRFELQGTHFELPANEGILHYILPSRMRITSMILIFFIHLKKKKKKRKKRRLEVD